MNNDKWCRYRAEMYNYNPPITYYKRKRTGWKLIVENIALISFCTAYTAFFVWATIAASPRYMWGVAWIGMVGALTLLWVFITKFYDEVHYRLEDNVFIGIS